MKEYGWSALALVLLTFLWVSLPAGAVRGADAARSADLAGVYQAVPAGRSVSGGKSNMGSPAQAPLLPFARAARQDIEQEEDPFKLCQPVGPFRMMAMAEAKIELVPTPGMIVMLFEDIAHGNLRTFHLNRPHLQNPELLPQGDSTARWEGDTLVIETTHLPDRNWLNDSGARPSSALRLTERIRPLEEGRVLEYTMRADDPKALASPYTYTRYFERTTHEIQEQLCKIESHWDCQDLCVK